MSAEHTAWKRPESVLVVVHTPAPDVLLIERVAPPGFWQSVTGSLEWGESAEAAARRELAEETGLDAGTGVLTDAGETRTFPILPAWRDRFAPGVAENVEHVWYFRVPAPVDVTLNPAEHRAAVWLPVDAAIERATSWTNRAAIEQLVRD